MSDRRRSPRIPVNDEFALIAGDLSEYISNLSDGGLFLRCEPTVPLGTELDLKFSVLLDDIEQIEGRGVVVHLGTPGQPGLGIRFLSLTPQSQFILAQVRK